MERYDASDLGEFVNIGSGREITIHDLADLIAEAVGYTGRLTFDTSKPDSTPRKLLDVSRVHALGWEPKTDFRDGIRLVYQDFLQHYH